MTLAIHSKSDASQSRQTDNFSNILTWYFCQRMFWILSSQATAEAAETTSRTLVAMYGCMAIKN